MGRQSSAFIFYNPLAIFPMINILATSKKGKSRIGTKLTRALVEQSHGNKLFVVIYGTTDCRWIMKHNDPDFMIIE